MERSRSGARPVRIGFVQLCDAAPLIVAAEAGLFAALGISVILSRELGWASIRDKLLLGELDYVHALGPMPLAASASDGPSVADCVGLMRLSQNGNGITVSRKHWDAGVRSGEDLARFINNERWRRRFVFGVVAQASSHHFLLRQWLRSLDLEPGRDVEVVTLPPGQFLRNLSSNTIDGACVGEPWNTLAVAQGSGWCVASSMDIAPNHPEKTLMMTRLRLEERGDEAARIVAAVALACRWCDRDEAVLPLARMLSRTVYLQLPSRILHDVYGKVEASLGRTGGLRFADGNSIEFTDQDLKWMESGMEESGQKMPFLGTGKLRLTKFYPSAVAKNAQRYISDLEGHPIRLGMET